MVVVKPLFIGHFHCFIEKTVGKISLQLEILFAIGEPPSLMESAEQVKLVRDKVSLGWTVATKLERSEMIF